MRADSRHAIMTFDACAGRYGAFHVAVACDSASAVYRIGEASLPRQTVLQIGEVAHGAVMLGALILPKR
jgi:hypothetical protein